MWKLFRRSRDNQVDTMSQNDGEYKEVEIDGEVYYVGRMTLHTPIPPVPLDEGKLISLKGTETDK